MLKLAWETVELKEDSFLSQQKDYLVDLPGSYSFLLI